MTSLWLLSCGFHVEFVDLYLKLNLIFECECECDCEIAFESISVINWLVTVFNIHNCFGGSEMQIVSFDSIDLLQKTIGELSRSH